MNRRLLYTAVGACLGAGIVWFALGGDSSDTGSDGDSEAPPVELSEEGFAQHSDTGDTDASGGNRRAASETADAGEPGGTSRHLTDRAARGSAPDSGGRDNPPLQPTRPGGVPDELPDPEELRSATVATPSGTYIIRQMGPKDVARVLQDRWGAVDDLEAKVEQNYHDTAADETKTEYGTLYFKQPNRFRLDYFEDDEREDRTKTIVRDGTHLWVYELAHQQVFKKCTDESQLPLTVVFVTSNLLDRFDVSFAGNSPPGTWLLELEPDDEESTYEKLRLLVEQGSFDILKTTVVDPYDNTNEIRFREITSNQDLPDDGFEFEPPENVRLLNPDKACD